MSFFPHVVIIRLSEERARIIDDVVSRSGGKYSSRSHFVRCAIERLLRSEGVVGDDVLFRMD